MPEPCSPPRFFSRLNHGPETPWRSATLKALSGWTPAHRAHLAAACGLDQTQCCDTCHFEGSCRRSSSQIARQVMGAVPRLNPPRVASSACTLLGVSEADKTRNEITGLVSFSFSLPLPHRWTAIRAGKGKGGLVQMEPGKAFPSETRCRQCLP